MKQKQIKGVCLLIAGILFLLLFFSFSGIEKTKLLDTDGRNFEKAEVTNVISGNLSNSGSGKAITIFTDKDDKYINEIEAYLGYEIKVLEELKIDDIAKGKIKFEKKSKEVLKNRKNKIIEKNIHSEVTKIYINAGKQKKIKVIDIVW